MALRSSYSDSYGKKSLPALKKGKRKKKKMSKKTPKKKKKMSKKKIKY